MNLVDIYCVKAGEKLFASNLLKVQHNKFKDGTGKREEYSAEVDGTALAPHWAKFAFEYVEREQQKREFARTHDSTAQAIFKILTVNQKS